MKKNYCKVQPVFTSFEHTKLNNFHMNAYRKGFFIKITNSYFNGTKLFYHEIKWQLERKWTKMYFKKSLKCLFLRCLKRMKTKLILKKNIFIFPILVLAFFCNYHRRVKFPLFYFPFFTEKYYIYIYIYIYIKCSFLYL